MDFWFKSGNILFNKIFHQFCAIFSQSQLLSFSLKLWHIKNSSNWLKTRHKTELIKMSHSVPLKIPLFRELPPVSHLVDHPADKSERNAGKSARKQVSSAVFYNRSNSACKHLLKCYVEPRKVTSKNARCESKASPTNSKKLIFVFARLADNCHDHSIYIPLHNHRHLPQESPQSRFFDLSFDGSFY